MTHTPLVIYFRFYVNIVMITLEGDLLLDKVSSKYALHAFLQHYHIV